MSGFHITAGVNNAFSSPENSFSAHGFILSERSMELDRKQSYFRCEQHDYKRFDFDGRVIQPGPPTMQPLLSGEVAPFYVPLKLRRPSNPYRLGKTVVSRFTDLIFGKNRFPTIKVEDDPDTQDFAAELIRLQRLPVKMIEARNNGGSAGAVGLSWCFHNGKPRLEVHESRFLIVHRWADREEMIPGYVSEVYRHYKDIYTPETGKVERVWLWYRKDWSENADIAYRECLYEHGKEPYFEVDEENTVRHNDGECHFVWIQNLPSPMVDSHPDYDGIYERMDNIDILASVLARGGISNLDPTVVITGDSDRIKRSGGVKKGSDNAIVLHTGETVDYLELGGSSLTVGMSLFNDLRKLALEEVCCVVLDPDVLAAQGMSAVAMEAMFSSMTSKGDILRVQYGDAIERLIKSQVRIARKYYESGKALTAMKPRIVEEAETDDVTGEPTGKIVTRLVQRHPGKSDHIEIEWPPYFSPTPTDKQAAVSNLVTANGGKPVMSSETATRIAAGVYGIDPIAELQRLETERRASSAGEGDMFRDLDDAAGGKVDPPQDIPTEEEESEEEGEEVNPG